MNEEEVKIKTEEVIKEARLNQSWIVPSVSSNSDELGIST